MGYLPCGEKGIQHKDLYMVSLGGWELPKWVIYTIIVNIIWKFLLLIN